MKALPVLQGYIDPRIGWLEAGGAGLAALTAVRRDVSGMGGGEAQPASALRYE